VFRTSVDIGRTFDIRPCPDSDGLAVGDISCAPRRIGHELRSKNRRFSEYSLGTGVFIIISIIEEMCRESPLPLKTAFPEILDVLDVVLAVRWGTPTHYSTSNDTETERILGVQFIWIGFDRTGFSPPYRISRTHRGQPNRAKMTSRTSPGVVLDMIQST